MIDLREIDETIEHLKRNGSTRKEAEQLALLFIVREHLAKEEEVSQDGVEEAYSRAAEPTYISYEPVSEFTQAASEAPFDVLMRVLDEHMDCVKVMFPKEYDAVMRRLTE